jgi:2-polyprenyl-3-methyl-5-hydroxy-6-metoxy-1,4-benzoquinol methylase
VSRKSLFVAPKLEDFSPDAAATYAGKYQTYSHYNYLRPGLISMIKRNRFEVALEMASKYFGKASAIDFGCADGILLPSLSRYFQHATAVDVDDNALGHARRLVSRLKLTNVDVVCNAGVPFGELRARLNERAYAVLFLLETLEHIGRSPATMYDDKLAFLDDAFSLLSPGGVVVLSVPKMVGPVFLMKYVVQSALRMAHEHVSLRDLWRAGALKDVSTLEPRWDGGHIGFDDLKLARLIEACYAPVNTRDLAATRMWAIRRRNGAAAGNAA